MIALFSIFFRYVQVDKEKHLRSASVSFLTKETSEAAPEDATPRAQHGMNPTALW
ncbi:MAG: hypothetical protein HN975_19770 [Anaerolineae bacterium]|jgi:hypothetical protein|nr:hypothetical protein [Anaerolineae bacterium]MBT7990974.1 hypothetical protein [Anaerolineae bacterium]